MTANLISHHRPRRKRGRALNWAARRLGALIAVLAGIAVAAWLTPYIHPDAARFPDAKSPEQMAAPLLPEALEIRSPEPTTPVRAQRPRRSGVPLDAHPDPLGDDFEVLSASELDAISQARDQ